MSAGGKRTGAGRPKGSASRKTLEIEARLKTLKCDPFKVMATIANDKSAKTELRLTAAKELAQYIAPKRKAVEISSDDGSKLAAPVVINFVDAIPPPGD